MSVARFFSADNLCERLSHPHRVTDPGDLAQLVNNKCGRDTVLLGGVHPVLAHEAATRCGVYGNVVVHLRAHFLDKLSDICLELGRALVNANPGKVRLGLEFLGELR